MRNSVTALLLVASAVALSAAIATRGRIGHPVTPRMQTEAKAVAGRATASLLAQGSNGRTYALGKSDRGRPRVLIFIKSDCPCSEAAEPCFARLHAAYRDRADLLGIIAGDLPVAKDWVSRHQTPYPVLADPDLKAIQALGAERSAYTALVNPDGTIEHLWPGYSAGMLKDLAQRLADLTKTAVASLDVGEAPQELTSGCPF